VLTPSNLTPAAITPDENSEAGGRRWLTDGSEAESDVGYPYPFDRAAVSPSGHYCALYAERQTKGLILRDGVILRDRAGLAVPIDELVHGLLDNADFVALRDWINYATGLRS